MEEFKDTQKTAKLLNEIDEDIILNSIKDALIKEKYSITYIDRLILKKLNIQQNG